MSVYNTKGTFTFKTQSGTEYEIDYTAQIPYGDEEICLDNIDWELSWGQPDLTDEIYNEISEGVQSTAEDLAYQKFHAETKS